MQYSSKCLQLHTMMLLSLFFGCVRVLYDDVLRRKGALNLMMLYNMVLHVMQVLHLLYGMQQDCLP